MKKVLSIYFLLFSLCISTANAQSYFNKVYWPYIGDVQQALMPNDDIILVGYFKNQTNNGVLVNRFDKCGDLIWSKNISKKNTFLYNRNYMLSIDKDQNIIISGIYYRSDTIYTRNVFLMSLSPNGLLNYFKVIKTATDDILYSMEINKQNEILLYFKTNIGQAGPHSENTIAKFTSKGQLIWIKQYGFTGFWGKMCTTSDGGAIITNNRSIIKVNDKGIVQWTKEFQNGFNSTALFEVPNGIVIIRNSSSSKKEAYITLIDHNGKLKWNSQLIPNFGSLNRRANEWFSGILRMNGHLLIAGGLSHPDLNMGSRIQPAFIEMDTSSGAILKTLVQRKWFVTTYFQNILTIDENSKEEIVASGIEEANAVGGSFFFSKINKQLERGSCGDTLLNLNYPRNTDKIDSSKNTWVAQKVTFLIIEPSVTLDTFNLHKVGTFCPFSPTFPIFIGNDTAICPGNELVLSDTNSLFDHYQWSNGATTPTITIDTAGTYWLKVWNDCDTTIFSDSIQITYHLLPTINLGNDTSICFSDSILLSTNIDTTYWSTGDTAKSIFVSKVGTYWAQIPTICGFVSDSITIGHYPKLTIDLGNDTTLCNNNQLTLFSDSNATHYLWSTGDTTSSLQVDKAGSYWLKVLNICDTLTDTINVSFYPKANFKSSISSNTAFVNDSVHFQLVSPSKSSSLLWNFDDGSQSIIRNPWHVYEKSGTYQPNIFLTDSFGCKSDSIFQLLVKNIPIQVPNVFTPNGDGINDVFEIRGTGFGIQSIKIYDRWGQLTYQTNNTFWDGKTTNGYNASAGSYYYLIEYQVANEKSKTIRGAVMLIR